MKFLKKFDMIVSPYFATAHHAHLIPSYLDILIYFRSFTDIHVLSEFSA